LQSVLTNIESIEEVDHDDEELRDKRIVEQSSEICCAVSDIDAISLFDVLKNFYSPIPCCLTIIIIIAPLNILSEGERGDLECLIKPA